MATGRGQTVAVIDSRVDRGHPDLIGQVSSQEDFVSAHLSQAERHGTGVAGIIAARANNMAGIVGVAPDARIMALRACWERPDRSQPARSVTVCDSLSLAKALVFAIEHRAGVINLSLSGPQDRLIQTLVETGLARGITVVAAIDPARPGASFPAHVPGVIAVDDERLSAKEPGVYIAPGLDIPTTEPGGRWSLVNGTSFAAAHVSGLAALLRQVSAPGDARAAGHAFGVAGTLDACALLARRARRSEDGCRQRP
jgi:subtilisin family serine protease